MESKKGRFALADAKHHATVAEMPCTGDWKGSAAIDGAQLMRVLKGFIGQELVLISKDELFVVLKGGSSTFNLKRLEPSDKGKTKKNLCLIREK